MIVIMLQPEYCTIKYFHTASDSISPTAKQSDLPLDGTLLDSLSPKSPDKKDEPRQLQPGSTLCSYLVGILSTTFISLINAYLQCIVDISSGLVCCDFIINH